MSTISTIFNPFLKYRLVNHAGFWLFTILLLAYHGSLFGGNFRDNLINMSAFLPVQMAAAYLMIYVQIPRLLYRGFWIRFILSLLVVVYLLAVLARLSVIYIAQPIIGYIGIEETLWEIISDPAYLIKVFATSVYLPAFLLFLIKMTRERFTQQNRLITLEKEKRTTELDFLKAQMNPHFLFNTLNNIYSLSKNKSEQTPEMILKLSEILDYTIYECNEATVPIKKEWELIENYIDLETLRHSDQLLISIDQHIDDHEARIAPLILISLVENAFKYSIRGEQTTSNIRILLRVEQNVLTFEIFNTRPKKGTKLLLKKGGIGVRNVKRQLALQYPDRHTIRIDDQPNSYEFTLTIQL